MRLIHVVTLHALFVARVEGAGRPESHLANAGDDGAQFAGKLRGRRDLFDPINNADRTNGRRGRVDLLGNAFQPENTNGNTVASDSSLSGSQASNANCDKFMAIQLYFDSSTINFEPDSYACKSGSTYVGSNADGNVHITLVPSSQSETDEDRFHASVTVDSTGAVYSISPAAKGEMTVTLMYQEDFMPEIDPIEDLDPNGRELRVDRSINNEPTSISHHRAVQEDSVIDVMVLWTAAAECQNSGEDVGCTRNDMTESNMRGTIQLAVDLNNVAYTLSGVNAQLNLVHAYLTDYIEPSSNVFSASVNNLRGMNDGFMDDAHAKRVEFGADAVHLIIHDADNTSCGVAFVGPEVDRMFGVTYWICATGNLSFGHEIAHNLGCLHDRGGQNACNRAGFNFGFRDPEAQFRSIMALNCRQNQCDNNPGSSDSAECTRVQRFSNPTFPYPDSNGSPIGNAGADNVRRINDVRVEVAAYFDRPIPTSQPSGSPSLSPINPTNNPTTSPSKEPTLSPINPTSNPTDGPTNNPTTSPSKEPTLSPINPTANPTGSPTKQPTAKPVTDSPTKQPTDSPTRQPAQPSGHPSVTGRPTSQPSGSPTLSRLPSSIPSSKPSSNPSSQPSLSSQPSVSGSPTLRPSSSLSPSLTVIPSLEPSMNPSISLEPSMNPSILLVTIENNRGTGRYNLCQGDCDRDTDCIGDLLCFRRQASESVPGCSGDGLPRRDYCFARPPNYLFDIGNGLGTNSYGLCDGDCDEDTDCKDGLRCFQRRRGNLDPVLGCDGLGTIGTDYCFDRPSDYLFDIGNNLGTGRYGLCEGDCDDDADCIGDLLCAKRNDLSKIPGCDGVGKAGNDYCRPLVLPTQNPTAPLTPAVPSSSPIPSNTPTTSPTQNPTSPPTSASPTSSQSPTFPTLPITRVGNNGEPKSVYPLGRCEGDCDTDGDCEASFKCFQRTGREEIPGCSGLGDRGTDYCFFRLPNFLFDIQNNLGTDMYNLCEGDCDEDADCVGDLRCFRRRAFETIPGCTGTGREGLDYCFQREPNSLFDIGNNLGANSYALCDGDCDADADCIGDLQCFFRGAFEPIPGCTGTGRERNDYCFKPEPN